MQSRGGVILVNFQVSDIRMDFVAISLSGKHTTEGFVKMR